MKFDATIGEQAQSFEYSQGEQVFKGVYAPDLFAYRSAEGVARDTLSVQSDPLTDTTTSIAVNKLSMTAKPGAEGGVDIAVRQTLTDVGQSVGVKPLPPTEGESQEEAESRALLHSMLSSVGLKASEVDTVASAAGLRNVEAVELYRLVLKNADAIAADHKAALAGPFGEELRAALMKILPIWSAFDVAWTARDASFQSSFATLRVAETKQSTRMTGLARDARLDSDISFEGFSLEGPFLQPWAARFIPKTGEFGVSISGIDLATPADLALRKVDFTADEPFSEEAKAEILENFAPDNITITLKPSVLRATDLDLNLSGELHFVDEKPEGTLTARASGLERTIESLQRAAEKEPDLFQVVGMVQMAQGFGRKTDAGEWEWVVEAAADGSVSVNGNMLKGPDPEVDPEALSDENMGVDVEPDAGTDTDTDTQTDSGTDAGTDAGEAGQQ